MILGELESFFSLLDRAKRSFLRLGRDETPPESNIARRFVAVFENHGIHRNQIPHFLNGRLTHAQVQKDEALLDALEEDLLVDVTTRFAVRREWLDGADSQVYPLHDFYKRPDAFLSWIEALSSQSGETTGVLMVAKDEKHDFDALLVFEEQFAWLGAKPVYRYHLCNNWMFSYWKSRAYLAACVAMAWKQDINVSGRDVSIEEIRRYSEGQVFLDYAFGSALPMAGKPWYPEDLTLQPDAFLEGLDDEFSNEHGLALWLKLERTGVMASDLPTSIAARSAFQSALNELSRTDNPAQ